MQRADFQHALHLGLGRVILFLQHNDATPFQDIILHGCLQHMADDPQVEGSRAEYMYAILHLTNNLAFYRDAILAKLATVQEPASNIAEDEWDFDQWMDLAVIFARHGDTEARQLLYSAFTKRATDNNNWGTQHLIELDGLDGLIFAARHLSRTVAADETSTLDDWHLLEVEELCGQAQLLQRIEAETLHDPQLKAYLDYPRPPRGKQKEIKLEKYSYEEIRQKLAVPNITLSLWGKKTSSEELAIAAQAFLAEKDPKMLPGHLSIFRMRRFPLGHEKILQLAQITDQTISHLAMQALAYLQHPDIRTLAYQLAKASPGDSDALYLLENNYYPEDYQFIEEIIRQVPEEELHGAAICTIDIFTAHPTINSLKALTKIYEHVPCAYCREKTIRLLIEQEILPIWMMEECLYDSNEDIQKLVLTYMQKDTL